VRASHAMNAVDLIARKRDGLPLSAGEWEWFVHGFVQGEVHDYQMAAMLMAVRLRGMAEAEAVALTLAMATSGEQMDLRPRGAADKHSTGGVGDKVTLIVAPIVAACGVPVAKMSGRGLAHTGGTLDKLESIRGFRVRLERDEFLRVLDTHGLVLAGQSESLAPADAGMYALRDVTATVDSIPLIAASIMSKKLAVGAATILLDVKAGSGAFMKTAREARRLARLMVQIGEDAGRRTAAVITEMEEPLGRAAGNALEVRESVEVLRGDGPAELRDLCLDEAAHLLHLAGREASIAAARASAARAIESGAALAVLRRVTEAQGGDPRQIEEPERLSRAPLIREVRSPRRGFIARIDALAAGRLVMGLGAGRATKHDTIRHDTGILLRRVHGDEVEQGEPLAEVHAGSPEAAERAEAAFLDAITWSEGPVEPRRLVLGHVGAGAR
jgi:pyrimidine-nucleoside phosphorylase